MLKKLFKLPVLLVLLFMALMMLADLMNIGVKFHIPNKTITSLVFLCFGIMIIAIGGYTFRKKQTTVNPMTPELTSYLVTHGIYRISRNPMYIGFLAWLLACALFIGNFVNFLLFPLYIFLVNRLYIEPEEEALKAIFDEEFETYKNNVRRWL